MQVVELKKEGLNREYKVTVEANEIQGHVETRLKEVGKTVKIPGFRPGKAPMSLLKTRYGTAVMGEVLERAVNDSMTKAMAEQKLRAAVQPKVEVTSFDEGKDLEYTMAVELLPDVKVMDYSKLTFEKLVCEPTDDAVMEAIEQMADTLKSTEAIKGKRASKKGDTVVIDFDGMVDGERKDGMKSEDFNLELGSGSFIDTFEDQLTGKKAGDKLDVNVTFPKDYGSEELAGKDAVFAVEIKEIRETVKQEINDEMATKMGQKDLASLKEIMKENMGSEYEQVSRTRLKRELLDALEEGHDLELPQTMVDMELENILNQIGQERQMRGEEPEITDEEKEEFRVIAARRVCLGLVLSEVGNDNNIQVSNQELQQAVMQQARQYPGQEAQIFEHFRKNPQALEGIRAPLFEDKVVDFMLDKITLTEKTVTLDEMRDAEAAAEEAAEKKAKSKAKKPASKKKAPAKKAAAKKAPAEKEDEKKDAAKKKPAAKKKAPAKKAATKTDKKTK